MKLRRLFCIEKKNLISRNFVCKNRCLIQFIAQESSFLASSLSSKISRKIKIFFSSARGEMFLFFSNGDSPVLIGLLAGESASIVDKVNEEHLVAKAMLILTTIFPQCPKKVEKVFFDSY